MSLQTEKRMVPAAADLSNTLHSSGLLGLRESQTSRCLDGRDCGGGAFFATVDIVVACGTVAKVAVAGVVIVAFRVYQYK